MIWQKILQSSYSLPPPNPLKNTKKHKSNNKQWIKDCWPKGNIIPNKDIYLFFSKLIWKPFTAVKQSIKYNKYICAFSNSNIRTNTGFFSANLVKKRQVRIFDRSISTMLRKISRLSAFDYKAIRNWKCHWVYISRGESEKVLSVYK